MYLQSALSGPTATIAEFLESQLVCPDLYALCPATIVANTYHDGLDFAKCGITHDGDTIAGVVFVVSGEESVHGSHTNTCLSITLFLERSEDVEVDVDHVLRRPNCQTTLCAISVVVAFRCKLQGNFVLVVVALVVGAETDEDAALSVGCCRNVLGKCIRVDIHLQMLILAHVVVAVLIDCLCLTTAKIACHHTHGLLVGLDKL